MPGRAAPALAEEHPGGDLASHSGIWPRTVRSPVALVLPLLQSVAPGLPKTRPHLRHKRRSLRRQAQPESPLT